MLYETYRLPALYRAYPRICLQPTGHFVFHIHGKNGRSVDDVYRPQYTGWTSHREEDCYGLRSLMRFSYVGLEGLDMPLKRFQKCFQ